jgi:hypothetical protein
MQMIQVFDPAMCCDTGICGPSVDPKLARFAADLDWLKGQGIKVERFNLSQQPAAFAADGLVKGALESKGIDALPLVKLNEEVKSTGRYPSRDELAGWAGIAADAPTASVYTDAVAALVGLAASVGATCEACFKVYYAKARELGIPTDDIVRAIKTAEKVKAAPPRRLSELVEKTLTCGAESANTGSQVSATDGTPTKTGTCC